MTDPFPKGRRSFVLIVDDNERDRAMLSDVLEHAGYRVTTAADGWQAVVQSEGLNVELVVLDILMPGLYGSGFEAYHRLRASPYVRKDLPILFVTAASREKVGKDIPVDPQVRILYKPLDLKQLLATVRELLGPGGSRPQGAA